MGALGGARGFKYAEEFGLTALGDDGATGALVMEHWESVLGGLESDPASLADTLDWVAEEGAPAGLPGAALVRVGGHPWLAALALQYHDLRPDKSVFRRLDMRTPWSSPAQVTNAVSEPPRRHPCVVPGQVPGRWPDAVVTANWDSLVFDIGSRPVAARPYDGPPEGNSRAHRSAPGREHRTG